MNGRIGIAVHEPLVAETGVVPLVLQLALAIGTSNHLMRHLDRLPAVVPSVEALKEMHPSVMSLDTP